MIRKVVRIVNMLPRGETSKRMSWQVRMICGKKKCPQGIIRFRNLSRLRRDSEKSGVIVGSSPLISPIWMNGNRKGYHASIICVTSKGCDGAGRLPCRVLVCSRRSHKSVRDRDWQLRWMWLSNEQIGLRWRNIPHPSK